MLFDGKKIKKYITSAIWGFRLANSNFHEIMSKSKIFKGKWEYIENVIREHFSFLFHLGEYKKYDGEIFYKAQWIGYNGWNISS